MMVLDSFQFTEMKAVEKFCFVNISQILNENSDEKCFFFGIEILRPLQKKSESLFKQGEKFYQFHNDQVYVQDFFSFAS